MNRKALLEDAIPLGLTALASRIVGNTKSALALSHESVATLSTNALWSAAFTPLQGSIDPLLEPYPQNFLTPTRGQSCFTSHCSQAGLRAKQRRRPCQMSQWLNSVHCSGGTSFIKACSIFSGLL
jgi:hypothetical protein